MCDVCINLDAWTFQFGSLDRSRLLVFEDLTRVEKSVVTTG